MLSPIIIDIKTAFRLRLEEVNFIALQEFAGSTRPVYTEENGRLTHVGTCVLFLIGGRKYLVTAAHVLDYVKNTGFVIGVNNKTVSVSGEFNRTNSISGDPDDDHVDLAYIEIGLGLISEIGDVKYITERQFSHNRINSAGRMFTMLGYPNSKNKDKLININGIRSKMYHYSSNLVKDQDEILRKLKSPPNKHLIVDFDVKRSLVTKSGAKQIASHPRGMSGGLLLDIGSFGNPDKLNPVFNPRVLVGGILIEYKKEFKAVIAIKIQVLVEAIKDMAV